MTSTDAFNATASRTASVITSIEQGDPLIAATTVPVIGPVAVRSDGAESAMTIETV
jgi:hypothetical protein